MSLDSIALAKKGLEDVTGQFRRKIESHPVRAGRRTVPPDLILAYLSSYSASRHDLPWEQCPPLNLSRLEVNAPIEFPPGDYPSINAQDTAFHKLAKFDDIRFHGEVSFESIGTSDQTTLLAFSTVVFHKGFRLASVKLSASFRSVAFHDTATLIRGTVEVVTDCEFQGAVMAEAVLLEGAISNSNFRSSLTLVGGPSPIRIDNSTVAGQARFTGTQITELALGRVQFSGPVVFEQVNFSGPVSVSQVVFADECSFDKSSFGYRVLFEQTEFARAPRFYGVDMFSDVSFETVVFKHCKTISDANAYRQLRRLAPAEDGKFFALEQRSRANAKLSAGRDVVAAILSKFYDWFSEYGQSVGRPLLLLAGLTAAVAILFSCTALADCIAAADSSSRWATENAPVGLALQNLFNPIGMWSKGTPFVAKSGAVVVISIFQSMLSLVFIALFLLAVRRRFRKASDGSD